MSDDETLPDEATALFRGAPDRFVADRDALVAELRAAGRDDDAAAVKALRKPTVVAWALNQLAVRDPDGIGELLDAGSEVRAAQQAALSSKRGAGERLRAAGAARKAAVARLAAEAAGALAEQGGKGDAHAEAIGQALEASATDPEAGARLAAGTMQRPPEAASGFGDMLGLTALEGGDADTAKPSRGRSSRRSAAPRSDAEQRAELARLRRDRDAARRAATKARSSADAFARELEGMRRRLEVVERKHAAAEAAASERELELARAERELRRASDGAEADG